MDYFVFLFEFYIFLFLILIKFIFLIRNIFVVYNLIEVIFYRIYNLNYRVVCSLFINSWENMWF